MTDPIDAMIRDILRHEGGFVDHPNDRGGATNHGVSLRYARGIGLDNDGDGDTDADDIRLVTPDQAAALYREDFFTLPRLHALPAAVQPILFDWSVLSGPPRVIMRFQRLLNTLRLGPVGRRYDELVVDGRVGPKTRRAAEAVESAIGGPRLVNAIVDDRLAFHRRLVGGNPSQRVFLHGWDNRAESFRQPEETC
jgi:lysozyme family protein